VLPQTLHLEVVTPERRLFEGDVPEVMLPGSEGYLGVRPGHTPLLTSLGIGMLVWIEGGTEKAMAISGGYAEVLPDKVSVLAVIAERAEEIDLDRARVAGERATTRLARLDDPDLNYDRARAALQRAQTRLEVAKRFGAGVRR
jgi:F-type H+-transporting ATPase subunit epsilon